MASIRSVNCECCRVASWMEIIHGLKRMNRPVSLSLLLLLSAMISSAAACAGTSEDLRSDASLNDASGESEDASNDAGSKETATDSGADEILGTHAGASGTLRAELTQSGSSLIFDSLVFVAGETYAKPSLSPGGQRLYDTPNAGGSSTESEVMSYEVLRACEGAKLLKTETEVTYGPASDGGANSITDILVEIDGKKVGVSVTRAYKPKNQGTQSDAEIKSLLEKKLEGILASTARVSAGDKWVKQVLHVFAATQASADGITRVFPTIDTGLRADTIVLVTRTEGGGFIYCEPDPALGSECP